MSRGVCRRNKNAKGGKHPSGLEVLFGIPNTDAVQRTMDLSFLTYFGSRGRNEADWKAILNEADPRFHLSSIRPPNAKSNQLILIEWRGENS